MANFTPTGVVNLPWPDPGLSPNARLHFRPLAKLKAAAREAAAWETALQIPVEARRAIADKPGRIPFRVTFYPPDRRLRDDDNMVASIKAARDGIAQALGVDDRRFQAEYIFADPAKPGRVEVEFSPAKASGNYAQTACNALKESGRQSAGNTHTALTTNAKDLRDGS